MPEEELDMKSKIKQAIEAILGASEVDIEEIKDELWEELAILYYKYDDKTQKKAFREVMKEISKKMEEGKWETIYQRLYRRKDFGGSKYEE